MGAQPERPNLVARLRGTGDGPTLCLLSHVDTVLATPEEWTHDPWSGDSRRRVRLGARCAGHEVADRRRGRGGDRAWRRRAGGRRAATCWSWSSSTRRPAGRAAPSGSASTTPTSCAATYSSTRAPAASSPSTGAATTASASPRRASSASVSHRGRGGPRVDPQDRRQRAAEDGAAAAADGRPPAGLRRHRRAAGAARRAGPGRTAMPPPHWSGCASATRLAILVEPMLGVTLAPTRIRASEKINVIPSRAELAGRLPRAARASGRRTRCGASTRSSARTATAWSSPSRSWATARPSSRR